MSKNTDLKVDFFVGTQARQRTTSSRNPGQPEGGFTHQIGKVESAPDAGSFREQKKYTKVTQNARLPCVFAFWEKADEVPSSQPLRGSAKGTAEAIKARAAERRICVIKTVVKVVLSSQLLHRLAKETAEAAARRSREAS